MKRFVKKGMPLLTAAVMLLLLVASVQAYVSPATLGFCHVTYNDPAGVDAVEGHIFVEIHSCADSGLPESCVSPNNAVLLFYNDSTATEATINQIYVDDGMLDFIADLWSDSGDTVSFDSPPTPGNLPGGENVIPPFVADEEFSVDSDPNSGGVDNGVNVGEWIGIEFSLDEVPGYTPAQYFDAVVDVLISGDLRIGIHVQSLPTTDPGTGLPVGEADSESFITCGDPYVPPPTAITLASFAAYGGLGSATVMWETGTELDNAGFNLYRSAAPDGPFTKVNDGLIPAQGDAVGGGSYAFVDGGLAGGTYYYLLQDVGLNGVATQHGPALGTVLALVRRPLVRPGFAW